MQIEGKTQTIQIDPVVIAIELDIPAPTISDLRSDAVRVRDALIHAGVKAPIDFMVPVLEEMSPLLRKYQWRITMAMRKGSVVAILPTSTLLLGLAVDVGTTKLAAYLCDLQTGEILAKAGAMNPQTAFGEDVISRISYSNNVSNGSKTLQVRVIDSINQLLNDMRLQIGNSNHPVTSDQIVEAVVVGNTAMHHLFVGLPVHQLGMAPYVPAESEFIGN